MTNQHNELTLRDKLAMAAPPVPEGFTVDYESKLPKPERPKLPEGITDEQKKMLKDWVADPCWDLEAEFAQYQKDWENHWDQLDQHKIAESNEALIMRQVQWSYAYADAVIKHTKGPTK